MKLQHLGLAGLGLCLVTQVAVTPLALAKTELKDLSDPLNVQVTTPVDGTDADAIVGTPFEATLTETVAFGDDELPAGTVFKGTVEKTRDSFYLAHPGYVAFAIKSVQYPNGRTVDLTDDIQRQKLFHDDANTIAKSAKQAWPFAAVNAAVALPLALVEVSGGALYALGAKMGLGVIREFTWKEDKLGEAYQKAGHGVWVGTGIPGALFIASKKPEPVINEGDNINLFLDADNMALVFAGAREGNPVE